MAKSAPTQPNQAPASRLPSTRESRPALIGLALLLIVGGALASAYLALVAGNRAEFVQVRQEIAQGEAISEDDLTTVSLPDGYDGGIPASDMDDLVDKSTTVRLLPGTVMTREMVSDKGGIPEGKAQVTVDIAQATAAARSRPATRLIIVSSSREQATRSACGAGLDAVRSMRTVHQQRTARRVPAFVQIDSGCNATVSAGHHHDAISVSRGTPSGSAGC